jgi:hypothetical protein
MPARRTAAPIKLGIAHGRIRRRGAIGGVGRIDDQFVVPPAQELVQGGTGVVVAAAEQQHGFVLGRRRAGRPVAMDDLGQNRHVAAGLARNGQVMVEVVEMEQP